MPEYLYRRGDGNEGSFPRYVVELPDAGQGYDALRALLANDYIAGRRVRRWIMREMQIDGEPDYGLSATVYRGPDGEEAFGAAWLTAELQPLSTEDATYYREQTTLPRYVFPEPLDRPARRYFRELQSNGKA